MPAKMEVKQGFFLMIGVLLALAVVGLAVNLLGKSVG